MEDRVQGVLRAIFAGVLLADKATRNLVESGQIATIDSCSFPGGFMAQLLTGRRTLVDVLIDVRPRNSLTFAVEVAQHRGYRLLRHVRRRGLRVVNGWDATGSRIVARIHELRAK
jgi:hypothetical protein